MDEYKGKTGENLIHLVIDRKQLGYIHFLVSILIGMGVALFFYPFCVSLNWIPQIGFHCIGAFIWILGMITRIKINKLMNS